jgi:hypothetical protein
MKPNLFLNPYQQPENKLTYNFLSLINLLNSREFLEWLTGEYLSDEPLLNIEPVFGGGKSNPDGCITIKNRENKPVKVYIENKTYRLGISKEQLISHLDWLNEHDKLLVITPRPSDRNIIKEINSKAILFKTWPEIAEYLKNNVKNIIAEQFIEYGRLSGEFDEFSEISNDEIKIFTENFKVNFDQKISSIFNNFIREYDFSENGLKKIKPEYRDHWGRRGVELYFENNITSYDQWCAVSYYYSNFNHHIQFKRDMPEIVFFFDVDPKKLDILKADHVFLNIVERLEQAGFESNLNGEITDNSWRLLVFRKPIIEFDVINVNELCKFTGMVISLLRDCGAFEHKYFNEFT